MTQLIVCCDGTWNTLGQTDQGLPAPTNVAKLYNAVVKDEQQLAYYHPGVGTGDSAAGLASSVSLSFAFDAVGRAP